MTQYLSISKKNRRDSFNLTHLFHSSGMQIYNDISKKKVKEEKTACKMKRGKGKSTHKKNLLKTINWFGSAMDSEQMIQ